MNKTKIRNIAVTAVLSAMVIILTLVAMSPFITVDQEMYDDVAVISEKVANIERKMFDTKITKTMTDAVGVEKTKPHVKVVRYIDGDTVYIHHIPTEPIFEKLRFLRIDTPERGQKYYKEASVAIKKMLSEATIITLEFESDKPGAHQRGNYNRLLVYVYADGKMVNLEMVRLGWSKFYTKYGAGKYADKFMAAEKEAKKDRRGIWR